LGPVNRYFTMSNTHESPTSFEGFMREQWAFSLRWGIGITNN
jgi:hypothetical protein